MLTYIKGYMKYLLLVLLVCFAGCSAICDALPELDIDLNPLCVTPTPVP